MRVWLDDVRPMPDGFDVHVQTAEQAIDLLRSCKVISISLDHDLGPPEAGTGYDVAKQIEEWAYFANIPELEWAIHSANPVGRQNMERSLRNAERYWAANRAKFGVDELLPEDETSLHGDETV